MIRDQHDALQTASFIQESLMSFEIRKIVSYAEETFIEVAKRLINP
jgi:hypothetical protein